MKQLFYTFDIAILFLVGMLAVSCMGSPATTQGEAPEEPEQQALVVTESYAIGSDCSGPSPMLFVFVNTSNGHFRVTATPNTATTSPQWLVSSDGEVAEVAMQVSDMLNKRVELPEDADDWRERAIRVAAALLVQCG